MKKIFLASFIIVSLSACNSTPTMVGPNGDLIHHAKCAHNKQTCMTEANQVCQGSYQVLDSESHMGGAIADILPGPFSWYGLTYKCGKSDGKVPTFNWK